MMNNWQSNLPCAKHLCKNYIKKLLEHCVQRMFLMTWCGDGICTMDKNLGACLHEVRSLPKRDQMSLSRSLLDRHHTVLLTDPYSKWCELFLGPRRLNHCQFKCWESASGTKWFLVSLSSSGDPDFGQVKCSVGSICLDAGNSALLPLVRALTVRRKICAMVEKAPASTSLRTFEELETIHKISFSSIAIRHVKTKIHSYYSNLGVELNEKPDGGRNSKQSYKGGTFFRNKLSKITLKFGQERRQNWGERFHGSRFWRVHLWNSAVRFCCH